jgi:hypothetical protein
MEAEAEEEDGGVLEWSLQIPPLWQRIAPSHVMRQLPSQWRGLEREHIEGLA